MKIMLGKNNPQTDMFAQMIYEKLIPKDHLLVKIDSFVDFSFVYETLEDRYSKGTGRASRDPVTMTKLILLEYLYNLSDVSVNASLPFGKKLIRDAFKKVIRQIETFDEELAEKTLLAFEADISKEYESEGKVDASKHYEIAIKHLESLYVKTHDELSDNDKYQEAYQICYEIADSRLNNSKDKIVSVVDTDARAAYKSPRNAKIGYKNHIVIDEDSEIILASEQTPFNVGDEKRLSSLVDQATDMLDAGPEEVTADKNFSQASYPKELSSNSS